MTAGIQSVAAAASGNTVIAVTVGTNAGDYGYLVSPAYGSRTPTLLYGENIKGITTLSTSFFVGIGVGTLPQNFFNRITIKYGVGAASSLTLTSASATYTTPGGVTQWTWATSPAWTATDNGLARFVIFYR